MHIVKLDAIDSTNSYLRRKSRAKELKEDTLVWAQEQTAGRGQMGTHWFSQAGQNLTFSVFRKVTRIQSGQQFYITMATSLAIAETLEKLQIEAVSVKWPNDILAGKQKICGILIESVIKKGRLEAVILGIGLNVNQTDFDRVAQATSIKKETGIHFALEDILQQMISQFHHYVDLLTQGELAMIKSEYEEKLFLRDRPATFEHPDGSRFVGIIQGVSEQGRLQILLEDDRKQEFDMKAIKLLY
ncbi:biotin--[acetyl-CoA-carboxylase] ligase [Croceiramulus getboli]|nr:biotin--[acetyl-CoA-carboxylase] ligase [Flavobacteriaceae bacterium YJPT1-3]